MPKLKPGTILPTQEEDEAIGRGIASDPDTYQLDNTEATHLRRAGRPKSSAPKVLLTVRYDADIVQAFKAGGAGWQTRMNSALRDWLKTHRVQG